jgi:hypothetical protein
MIAGRVVHKKSNALKISFQDGPGDPFATGIQGAGDGTGSKLGILFGFKNGGSGTHVLTYQDGAELRVRSKGGEPTVLSRSDGVEVATIHRGETSTAVLSGGGEVFRFVADPELAKTPDLFRLLVKSPSGEDIGRLDVIRKVEGWQTLAGLVEAAWHEYIWWDQAGRPLPIPIVGTQLILTSPVSDVGRDVLLGACVDIALGLRPYVTEMK